MLDPITAIGLASAIVQFVDFSTKLFHDAEEIYVSSAHTTKDNERLEAVVRNMKNQYLTLSAQNPSRQSKAERALCEIATECNSLSTEILKILQKVKPEKPNSFRSSFSAAFKSKTHSGKIAHLKENLNSYQGQLASTLSLVTRFDDP
jgi:hypothetical protein